MTSVVIRGRAVCDKQANDPAGPMPVEVMLVERDYGGGDRVWEVSVQHGNAAALVRSFFSYEAAASYFGARIAAYDMAVGR